MCCAMHVLRIACIAHCMRCALHALRIACVVHSMCGAFHALCIAYVVHCMRYALHAIFTACAMHCMRYAMHVLCIIWIMYCMHQSQLYTPCMYYTGILLSAIYFWIWLRTDLLTNIATYRAAIAVKKHCVWPYLIISDSTSHDYYYNTNILLKLCW